MKWSRFLFFRLREHGKVIMWVVAEPLIAPQAKVPLNMQMPLLCVPPFISTHQPTVGIKDACHMTRTTDLTPNPRGGNAKAHWHRQDHPSGPTPLSSALEVTELTVHSIPVGVGRGLLTCMSGNLCA